MTYLLNQGFDVTTINEGLFDFLGSALGHSPEGVIQFFKEKLADKVLSMIGVDPNSWIGGVISTTIGNLSIKDIGKVLTDCSFTTSLIGKSISEEAINQIRQGVGASGGFYDVLSNTLVETLESSDIGQKLEEKFTDVVCPMISDMRNKFSKTETDLKDKIFS